jgi:hypothetical protein
VAATLKASSTVDSERSERCSPGNDSAGDQQVLASRASRVIQPVAAKLPVATAEAADGNHLARLSL